MATTGYSGKLLIDKLGIKPNMRVQLIGAPTNYMALLGADISEQVVKSGDADLVHLFALQQTALARDFKQLIRQQHPPAIIWISWYKKSAGMATDITENSLRNIVLPEGWVDIKVCAVSEQWSGLKIVPRKTGNAK